MYSLSPCCVAAAVLGAHVRAQVHARRVEPAEERLAGRLLPLHEVDGRGGGLVVDRLHALLGERAGVLDRLLADLAEARIDGRVVHVGRLAPQHAARPELGAVGRVLRIVGQLRLFLGVEVVEVAEELVEAVDGRQRLVAVADVVLAELAGGVAEVLEQAADRGIELAHAHRRAGEADLGQPGADAVLAGEERRAAGGARLLAVVVEEAHALLGDAVDVGRLVAHQAVAVGADVGDADVVAEDDEDVRLVACAGLRVCSPRRRHGCQGGCSCCDRGASQQHIASADGQVARHSRLQLVLVAHGSVPLLSQSQVVGKLTGGEDPASCDNRYDTVTTLVPGTDGFRSTTSQIMRYRDARPSRWAVPDKSRFAGRPLHDRQRRSACLRHQLNVAPGQAHESMVRGGAQRQHAHQFADLGVQYQRRLKVVTLIGSRHPPVPEHPPTQTTRRTIRAPRGPASDTQAAQAHPATSHPSNTQPDQASPAPSEPPTPFLNPGRMFWLWWKTLSGSYVVLTSASRS